MEKRPFNTICKVNDYTLISYEKKYIGTEFVIARNFDEENFSWDSSSNNYFYSVEDALAELAYKLGSEMVKSRYQRECEHKSEMTYDRLTELATLFKDGLIEDDRESAMEYFKETCEMTEQEMEFFGIEREVEDYE